MSISILLQENGDALLLETGDYIVLDDGTKNNLPLIMKLTVDQGRTKLNINTSSNQQLTIKPNNLNLKL